MKSFSKLTRAEKRVAIAKDVLLTIKYLDVDNGGYCKIRSAENKNLNIYKDIQELIPLIKNKEATCTVCAKGAIFISKAKLYNSCPINEYNKNLVYDSLIFGSDPSKFLLNIFTEKQLDLIERYFEGWIMTKATDYYTKYPNPENRLKAIMKNIIKNNGTFKP